MTEIEDLQRRLKSFADTVNAFKSEAVQLRVMDALIAQLGLAGRATAPQGPARTSRRRPRHSPKAKTAPPSDADPKAKASRPRKAPTGVGAYAAISQLLESGFFSSGKTIGDIVEHCKTAKGHHYKANECSPALLRLLRDEKLTREKNESGQYEYTKA
jgi:hypothetical protein